MRYEKSRLIQIENRNSQDGRHLDVRLLINVNTDRALHDIFTYLYDM